MSNFVTLQDAQKNEMRKKNLFHTAKGIWFLWLTFHFLIIYFFWLQLESPLLVGLFLWIWNFVALLFDIPVGVLQKYIKPKTFLILSTLFMFLCALIFLKFIYFQGISGLVSGWSGVIDATVNYLGIFLNSGLNLVLLLLAAMLYGIIKESYDVTTLSYIFNISTPSEYATLISKYNINFGMWAMVWLVLSWVLLWLGLKIAVLFLVGIIVIFLGILIKFFDNGDESIDFQDIKKLRVDSIKSTLIDKKDQFIQNISLDTLKTLAQNGKVVFLRPIQMKNEINMGEVVASTKTNFDIFFKILFSKPFNLIILWLLGLILAYGFWDTFVSTFQVEFLTKIIWDNQDNFVLKNSWGLITWYVLLWLMVIPAFVFQDFFIKLSAKIWVFKVVLLGSILSSASLFMFWFVDTLWLVLLFGLINSIWYAAVMPIAQATFWEKYNEEYAKKFNLKEIDSTVSAAPLKIVLNFANVVGLLIGWFIVGILDFNGFFIFFSLVLAWIFTYTVFHKSEFSKVDDVWNIEIPKMDEDFQ